MPRTYACVSLYVRTASASQPAHLHASMCTSAVSARHGGDVSLRSLSARALARLHHGLPHAQPGLKPGPRAALGMASGGRVQFTPQLGSDPWPFANKPPWRPRHPGAVPVGLGPFCGLHLCGSPCTRVRACGSSANARPSRPPTGASPATRVARPREQRINT